MKRFKPDPERENEALWGDKRGFEYAASRGMRPMAFPNGNGEQ